MKLWEVYQGSEQPFEDDLTLWLHGVPDNARVTRAIVTLTPVAAAGGELFRETLTFEGNGSPQMDTGGWGAERIVSAIEVNEVEVNEVEVDFHARRTLNGVAGSGTGELQMDVGGVYLEIADDGTFKTPEKDKLQVDFSNSTAMVDLPALTTTRFKLRRTDGEINITQVGIRSVPTNVSLRLGQIPPFWTHVGELSSPQGLMSPDFADVLNAFLLQTSPQHGFYAIPFVLHSDTIARLNVDLLIDYVIDQPVLPPHLTEVTIPYDYSTLPGIDRDLLTAHIPRGVKKIVATNGSVQGAFEASRIVGPLVDEPVPGEDVPVAIISAGCSLAQPIQRDEETSITGVDLPLENTETGTAGLHLAVQSDGGGKPSGEILTSAKVRVTRPLPGSSAWGSATLPDEHRLLKGQRYWLVLQSLSGTAEWRVERGQESGPFLLTSTDDGFSWHQAASKEEERGLVAVYRLRNVPERFTVPLHLQVGEGTELISFHKYEPLGRVDFDLDFASGLEGYLATAPAGPICGRGEQLVNGSFEQPPHDDASRLLFGCDAARVQSLTSLDLSRGVDLRFQRFILLGVDDAAPVRIDCAGSSADPARAMPNDIGAAIGDADAPWTVDVDESTGILRIVGPNSGEGEVVLYPWQEDGVPPGWESPSEYEAGVGRAKWPTEYRQEPAETDLAEEEPEVDREVDSAPRPARLVATLRPGEDHPTSLSQRVDVMGGCTYDLRFFFCTSESRLPTDSSESPERESLFQGPSPIPPLYRPLWEIRWLDPEGAILGRERRPLNPKAYFPLDEDFMQLVEVRLTAPADTAQAEIRFEQPPYEESRPLLLDDVSFKPKVDLLQNGDFIQSTLAEGDTSLVPRYWDLQGGEIALDQVVDLSISIQGVRLTGDGPQDTILSQVVTVTGGERYELQVRAHPELPLVDELGLVSDDRRARLELRWRDDEETPLGEVLLPLDGIGFPVHGWADVAPDPATQVEVRLVQPRGSGSLLVESVALVGSDLISVPLIFRSEATGELLVSEPRVVFEPPPPPREPEMVIPEPEERVDPEEARLRRIRPFRQMFRPIIYEWNQPALMERLRKLDSASWVHFFHPRAIAVHQPRIPEGELVEFGTRSPLANQPVGALSGVSDRIAGILAQLPQLVQTVEDLAALDLSTLEPDAHPGISRRELIALRSTAELALDLKLNAARFEPLAEEPLDDLLELAPEELARRGNQRVERAEEMLHDLRALILLFKDERVGEMCVKDLLI